MATTNGKVTRSEGTSRSSPASNGRDEATGKFLTGNSFGQGRPRTAFARRCAARRIVFAENFTDNDFRDLAQVLKDKGKAGDVEAIKVILLWCIGRPLDPISPDEVDNHELRMVLQ